MHLRMCLTLRQGRMLRQLPEPSRDGALPRDRAIRSFARLSPGRTGTGATWTRSAGRSGTSRPCDWPRPGPESESACRIVGRVARERDRRVESDASSPRAADIIRWVAPRSDREVFLGDVSNGEPGRQPTRPEHLGGPHVPDPGHELLPLKSLPERQVGSSAKSSDHGLEIGRLREDVGAEPPDGVAA